MPLTEATDEGLGCQKNHVAKITIQDKTSQTADAHHFFNNHPGMKKAVKKLYSIVHCSISKQKTLKQYGKQLLPTSMFWWYFALQIVIIGSLLSDLKKKSVIGFK